MMFTSLFSTDYGLVNAVLGGVFGMEATPWLTQPDKLKVAVAIVVFWRYVGFNLMLYLAALQTIPRDLYEAATLDGAGPWAKFWRITLPSLRPMILFGVTLSVIGGLQLFEALHPHQRQRRPDQTVMTSAIYLYRLAFDFNDFGGAAAMSWVLCGVVVVMRLC